MKLHLTLFYTILVTSLYSQDFDTYMNTDKYAAEIVKQEFENQFKTDASKRDFKRLREFLSEKQELLAALKKRKLSSYDDSKYIPTYQIKIQSIDNVIREKNDNDKVAVDASLISMNRYRFYDSSQSTVSIMVRDLKIIKDGYANDIKQIQTEAKTATNLDANINNVKDDIRACQHQIESALAPEYKQQQFRVYMSITFALLIAILLITFFWLVYKRSDSTLSRELLSGNGLQFITLFVLIISIILFGILSILQGSELAAILSGISGYILGKGTQRDLSSLMPNTGNTPVNTNTPLQGS